MPTAGLIENVALALGPRNGCDATHSGCENRDVRGECACRDDARAVLSVVAEAMREPTEEMVRSAVSAQSDFRMRIEPIGPVSWVVEDLRGGNPVTIGTYTSRIEAGDATIFAGQRAAVIAAFAASPLGKGE